MTDNVHIPLDGSPIKVESPGFSLHMSKNNSSVLLEIKSPIFNHLFNWNLETVQRFFGALTKWANT